jgi:hypothetical protein
MMVNAVGIAQVSHICKMAVIGMEKEGCHKSSKETPPCCNTEAGQEKNDEEPDCCTDVVKYYHQKVTTTLQQSFKVQPLIFFISLFVILVPEPESSLGHSLLSASVHLFEKTGKSIIIDLQTLLI